MLGTIYLIAYNLFCAAGWGYVWFYLIEHIYMHKELPSFENAFFNPTKLFLLKLTLLAEFNHVWTAVMISQTCALMEIIHSLVKLVRSPVQTTLMQVSSRILIVWGIVFLAPEMKGDWGVILATLSWSSVEVPRYIFYAWSLVSVPPYFMQWIRYSLFYVLYPSGITGELRCIWAALPYLRTSNALCYHMPNMLNMTIDYPTLLVCVLIAYIPGSPMMIGHMIKQRAKVLSKFSKKED